MRNDPAFGFSACPSLHDCSHGLTKREYFAAISLQGLLARNRDGNAADFAIAAVRMAYHLIEELEKTA